MTTSISANLQEQGKFPGCLVSSKWLIQHLGDRDLVVLDCTNFSMHYTGSSGSLGYKTISGRAHWEEEHIAGAGLADFTSKLSGDDRSFRNALPHPGEFAACMGELGIGDASRVVLYDSANSMWAARVWWMLRWIGFENAAILDGGWPAWKAVGGRTNTGPQECQHKTLSQRVRPEVFVTKKDVRSALDDATICIIDALSAEQFCGTKSDLGLCGHIPGARNVPATSLIDPATARYFPLERLKGIFGENQFVRTIVYCGSGIAAASVAFSLVRLGHPGVAIYMPGLQEWMLDDNAPLVNGPTRHA